MKPTAVIGSKKIKRIAVVGNAGAGKTTISRKLAKLHNLPLTHVDSIQFLSGMKIRPYQESIAIIKDVEQSESWIIDGFGPLDLIEKRFQASDRVIFIDFPIWHHYWWFFKRQIKSIFSGRSELPDGCSEVSLTHTIKVAKTIWKTHHQMRPELLRIFARKIYNDKIIYIRTLKEFRQLGKIGILDQ